MLYVIKIREDIAQDQKAKYIKVTQSDISQIENGARGIGCAVAKRIEKQFGVDYRSFFE